MTHVNVMICGKMLPKDKRSDYLSRTCATDDLTPFPGTFGHDTPSLLPHYYKRIKDMCDLV